MIQVHVTEYHLCNRRFPKPRLLRDFPQAAIFIGATFSLSHTMPHNCCVPLCRKKGYRTVTIAGKQAKVTYHNFPSESNRSKRKQWIHAIRRDVGKHFKPGKWTKICSLHFKETDFYNFWGSYRTLREDAIPSSSINTQVIKHFKEINKCIRMTMVLKEQRQLFQSTKQSILFTLPAYISPLIISIAICRLINVRLKYICFYNNTLDYISVV